MLSDAALLTPRLVGDVAGTFLVPDYQRGYRWGEEEVRRLLDDIKDAKGTDYYLQPVVVKQLGRDVYELVDGQQRLTTLYLILRCIHRFLPQSKVRYSIAYDTRPDSAHFLDAPNAEDSLKNIDFFHIYQAFETVNAWFGEQDDESLAAIGMYQALAQSVYVIWYEAPDTPEFDSRSLFTRLNMGRIPLTDAELVKARLLSRIDRQHETAAQWDGIERDLRSPEVWAFATGSADGSPTRISLLLETIADSTTGEVWTHRRPPFQVFETLRPRIESEPQELWDEVLDLHSLVLGWFDDRDIFHKVGYLVAAGEATFLGLVKAARGITKSCFEAHLDELICNSLNLSQHAVDALTYQSPKTPRVLLLMNVETVRRQKHSLERYSFDAHARRMWSLEHIHAQNSQGLNRVEQWARWLQEHRTVLDSLALPAAQIVDLNRRIDQALPRLSRRTFDALHAEITRLFTAAEDSGDTGDPGVREHNEVDAIANLALLDRDTNSSLSNAVFEVKRRAIIARDREGGYIPVCTRNVFLKYYTDAGAEQLHFWGPRDRDGYLRAMRDALAQYLLEDLPANDIPDVTDEEQL